jgi:hypothetical protein
LEKGIPKKEIHKFLDPDNNYAYDFVSVYIDFALENNWLVQVGEKYLITPYGKEFIDLLLPSNHS